MRGMLIGETALLRMLRLAPPQFSSGIARSQEVLALQRVYLIDAYERFVANKHRRLIQVVIQCVTQSADAAKVNLGKHPALSRRSAVPKLGVTCPPFFRCEAPCLLHHEIG